MNLIQEIRGQGGPAGIANLLALFVSVVFGYGLLCLLGVI